MILNLKNLFNIILFILLLSPVILLAQGGIAIDVSPENPQPGDEIRVSLSSFLSDLESSQISWTKDGKTELSGVGKTDFSFTVGDIGEPTTMEVLVILTTGIEIRRTITITPQGVDLLWEAPDSYVPPFYRGKALPASEARIKVVAMPFMKSDDVRLKAENLIYNWKRDLDLITSASGYGKNSYTFIYDVFSESERIDVEVSPLEGRTRASGSISIRPFATKILFYQKDDLEGIRFQKALGISFDLIRDTATIIAQPFFFSPKDALDRKLDYSWSINEEKIETPIQKNELVLRIGERGGTATLSLTIDHIKKVFQEATAEITINL